MNRGNKDKSNLEDMRPVKRVTPARFPAPGAPPKQPRKEMNIQVNIIEIDKFKELATLIGDMLKDERIGEEIRQEYINRFKKISGDSYKVMGK